VVPDSLRRGGNSVRWVQAWYSHVRRRNHLGSQNIKISKN